MSLSKRLGLFVFALVISATLMVPTTYAQRDGKQAKRGRPGVQEKKAAGYKTGQVVSKKHAAMSMPLLAGGKTSLATAAKGSDFLVIDFWSQNCPACKGSEKSFVALHKQFKGKKVAFLHINANGRETETKEQLVAMKKFVKAHDISVPIAIDGKTAIADIFGARRTPSVFVLEVKTMKVIYTGAPNDAPSRASRVTRNYLSEVLTAVTAGKESPIKATKPKG